MRKTVKDEALVRGDKFIYPIVPNRGAGIYNNFDENIPDFPPARPLFCSVLLMPLRLFGPTLLFGT